MRKKILIILVIFMKFLGFLFGQANKIQNQQFSLMCYNVENFMDTIKENNTNDSDFTPNGNMRWNNKRYTKKIQNISKVIQAIVSPEMPDIIGLVEVENKNVLNDLINDDILKKYNYCIIHEESPDERGIDVGFLYRKEKFQYISHQSIEVDVSFAKDKTRDILYVKGLALQSDILHIFINHWPSRCEGANSSEQKRFAAAKVLREKVNEIIQTDKDAKIIIMGDMNDEPTDKSILDVLQTNTNYNTLKNNELFNLLYTKKIDENGTYFFKSKWLMLDNLIVSNSILNNKKGLSLKPDDGKIFRPNWLLYKNKKTGEYSPNRTYLGKNYKGGFSDHLPVYMILTK